VGCIGQNAEGQNVGSQTCTPNSPGCVAKQASYFEISRREVSIMSTSSVMAGFASHRRHNAHALRDHPHVEAAVSLYGKYSTQKKFREMLQMPR
jgi:hypothetical protein